MKKTSLVLLSVAAFCVTPAFAGSQSDKEFAWTELGKDTVKQMIKDSESAQFRNVFFHRGADNVPMTCGEVNSKNSFGGYGGFQHFVSAGKPEVTFLEEQVADFQAVWKRFCE